jgi:prepilin-type N-terminal cleavage/methylation domain-containing protein
MRGNEDSRRTPSGRGQGGFTLIEVMVGIAVLVGALLGLALSMTKAYQIERVSQERKIALGFATAQMERLRSLDYPDLRAAPDLGYLVPGTWNGSEDVGFFKDTDGDGRVDYFGRCYYPDPRLYKDPTGTIHNLQDPLLLGLRPRPGDSRCATVFFREPDGTTGVGKSDGLWVEIRVFWRGTAGDSELKMGTFIAP